MTVLPRGGNAPLPATAVRAVLEWTGDGTAHDIDLSALLLGETGKVGDDTDFVFYNQPSHPSGAVVHEGRAGASERLVVDTAALPGDVVRVVLAASIADGAFGDVAELTLTVGGLEGEGEPLVFDSVGASSETALVVAEFYLRGGLWKLRAVGQGWDDGLASLATTFGVRVDGADAPPAEPSSAPDPVPVAAPIPAPSPASAPAPAPAPAPASPPAPAPLPSTPPERRRVVAVPDPRGRPTLEGAPHTLGRGETVVLTRNGRTPGQLWLRVSRTAVGGTAPDACVIAYDAWGAPVDVVHHGLPAGAGGAVRLVNRPVSDDPADTAAVEVRLTEVEPSVAALVVGLNTYSGTPLAPSGRVAMELVDPSGEPLVRADLPAPAASALLVASLVRGADEQAWSLTVLADPAAARTPPSLVGAGAWALSG